MRERDFTGDGGGDDWYEGVNPQRYDTPATAEMSIQTIPNGAGWTDAFKHAALAGGMGAVGGLLLGPIGAVGGLLTGLVMSTSVLQSHARETARINHPYMSGVARERRTLERQTQQERLLEKRRRKAMEKNSREDEWARFSEEKKNTAAEILRAYSIARYSLAIVSKQKAVIEIPWHTPWQLRRQLGDVLEAALQMRVASVSVRFCDGCGGKLAGPVAEALVCPLCGRRFRNEATPAQGAYVQKLAPTSRSPQTAPQPRAVQPRPTAQPQAAPTLAQTPPPVETVEDLLTDDDFVDETVGPLAEYQTWEPLEAEDYEERMTLEATNLTTRDLLNRTAKTSHTNAPVPTKDTKPKPEPPTQVAPQSVLHKPVNVTIISEPKSPAQTTIAAQPTQPSVKTTTGKGNIVAGRRVQCLGRYKDFTGIAQLVDKKKRVVKVLLDKCATSVSIAIDLVVPLEEEIAQ